MHAQLGPGWYYVLVDGSARSDFGHFTLQASVTAVPP
jgi:hypothetical protein